MKVIVVLALLIAAVVAQTSNYCVNLVKDDKSCEGFRSKWPAKACNNQNADLSSASLCDGNQYFSFYTTWNALCPLKNMGNQSFCEGTGYAFAYTQAIAPCLLITACTSDADCNPVVAPVDNTPVAVPPPFCFDCCQYCFDDTTCNEKVAKNDTYTKSTTCSPCKPADPVAAPTTGSTPSTTNAPGKRSTGAVVVVSGIVLAFSALFF